MWTLSANWSFDVPDNERSVGFEGENMVYTMQILTDTGPDWSYYIDLTFSNGTKATLPLRYRDGKLLVPLTRAYLQVDGMVRAQIRGMQGDLVKKSDIQRLFIQDSINASEELPPFPPTEFQLQEQIIQYMVDRVEQAAVRQPYPDADTGTWWVWDIEKSKYADSGVPCTVGSGSAGATEHSQLYGRDAPDQHPISAITKLEQELSNRVTAGDEITAMDIISILEG